MKHTIKAYNVIFPIWLMIIIPTTWIVVLPANFLIDLLVIVCTLKFLHVKELKKHAFSLIWKVWMCGFLADVVGIIAMFAVYMVAPSIETEFGRWWNDVMVYGVAMNPFEHTFVFLWVLVSVFIAGVCIYFFNKKISFKHSELEESIKKKLAISLAVFTAPYLFFLPTIWFVSTGI